MGVARLIGTLINIGTGLSVTIVTSLALTRVASSRVGTSCIGRARIFGGAFVNIGTRFAISRPASITFASVRTGLVGASCFGSTRIFETLVYIVASKAIAFPAIITVTRNAGIFGGTSSVRTARAIFDNLDNAVIARSTSYAISSPTGVTLALEGTGSVNTNTIDMVTVVRFIGTLIDIGAGDAVSFVASITSTFDLTRLSSVKITNSIRATLANRRIVDITVVDRSTAAIRLESILSGKELVALAREGAGRVGTSGMVNAWRGQAFIDIRANQVFSRQTITGESRFASTIDFTRLGGIKRTNRVIGTFTNIDIVDITIVGGGASSSLFGTTSAGRVELITGTSVRPLGVHARGIRVAAC